MNNRQSLAVRTPTFQAPEHSTEDIPVQEPNGGMSATQILTIVRFYWKITAIITVVIVAVSAVGIKFMPKTYTAIATLIVDSAKKDPLAMQEQLENGLFSYVQTQVELITSPSILLDVVDRMKLTEDPAFTSGFRGNDTVALRDYAEKTLETQLHVDIGRGGQLLYISAMAPYPQRAADIANAVTDAFIDMERRRSNGPAGERARIYSTELAELRAKVVAAQDALAAFRQHKGITQIAGANGEDTDTESAALADLEQRLLEAQNQRRSLESKAAGAQSSADEALASPNIQRLKTQLAEQQTMLAQLSITEAAHHPKVLELKSQIELTTRQLNEELSMLSANTSTQLARARELERRYTEAVDAQRTKVLHVRELQGEGAKLQLELDSAQSVYKRALDGFDQIVFASASNNANVSLIDRATAPSKPSKPNKRKLFMMACVFGLALGIAVPLGYALLINRKLRCRDDIERAFGISVLAEFEAIVPAGAA